MADDDDTLTLFANSQELTGWTASRVTTSLERTPRDFLIELTDRNPLNPGLLDVQAGMSCTVNIGSDPVIAGWIDRVNLSVGRSNHAIRIIGRSKCSDLVDCSVTPDVLVGGQIFTGSIFDLANRLCAPFKIPVSIAPGVNPALNGPGGSPLKVNAVLTETGWEILERVARWLGVLIYDMPDGSLMIANVGTSTMASGFTQGDNVEAASVTYSMDERFSVYLPSLMSTVFFGQAGLGGMPLTPAHDYGVTRPRPLVIVSEQFTPGAGGGKPQPFAETRAQWEMARRIGRSQAVTLTAKGWRDTNQTLWTQNAFAPVSLPALKQTDPNPWIIGSVSFIKDAGRGTVSDVMLMPKAAFQPGPINLVPFLNDPTTGRPAGGATASGPSGRTQSNDGPGL
jgi:prophage tail gpP-like protein